MDPMLLAERMVRAARAEASRDRVIDEHATAVRAIAGRRRIRVREGVHQLPRLVHLHRPVLGGR